MYNNYSDQVHYARESNLMYRVYAWMCAALAVTATSAYFIASTPSLMVFIHQNPFVLFFLFIVQLALVSVISFLIHRINFATTVALFLGYAFTLGITFSAIFIVFDMPSIFATFLVTSGMFAAMAAYGYFTRADLSSMGSFLFMGLIGLILCGLVNMFLRSESFDYVISGIGVLIFTLFTAYDVQRIKRVMEEALGDRQTMAKVTILGALSLYLDFVNLFLSLLRFMGRRKD